MKLSLGCMRSLVQTAWPMTPMLGRTSMVSNIARMAVTGSLVASDHWLAPDRVLRSGVA